MTTRISIICLVIGVGLISSCGTSKKLDAANSQISDLQSMNSALTSKNNELTSSVNTLNSQVADLSAQNKTINDQFASYKKQCQENEEELREVEAAFNELGENFAKLEERVEQATAEFDKKGIEVYSKDGILRVSMQDALLYKSGSASLNPDGKKALGNLASVLNEFPKLKVIVVGNTDDQLFKKGGSDNWSLSTERANGVVRVLRDDYKVDPARLTAAGKGKYDPVADNTTVEGRAKNRRTEIVLNPDWRRLWESVKKENN
jgi:chemotaxis protein MotB